MTALKSRFLYTCWAAIAVAALWVNFNRPDLMVSSLRAGLEDGGVRRISPPSSPFLCATGGQDFKLSLSACPLPLPATGGTILVAGLSVLKIKTSVLDQSSTGDFLNVRKIVGVANG